MPGRPDDSAFGDHSTVRHRGKLSNCDQSTGPSAGHEIAVAGFRATEHRRPGTAVSVAGIDEEEPLADGARRGLLLDLDKPDTVTDVVGQRLRSRIDHCGALVIPGR
jgi:hypothetical protein